MPFTASLTIYSPLPLQAMPLHYPFDCSMVIPLDLEIGYPTIPLCRFNSGMTQEILDRH